MKNINLEIITNIMFLILSVGFAIWNFYINSFATATFMTIFAIVSIYHLIKELKPERDTHGNN